MSSTTTTTGPPTLAGLPDEILLKIFTQVGLGFTRAGYPDRWSLRNINRTRPFRTIHTAISPCQTLWGVCLLSKRFNGPATEVLYESVDLCNNSLRNFLKTIITYPERAELVRRVTVNNGFNYFPEESFYTASVEVESMIIKRARSINFDFNLTKYHEHRKLVPNSDFEQSLAIRSLPQLTSIDLIADMCWRNTDIEGPGLIFDTLSRGSAQGEAWAKKVSYLTITFVVYDDRDDEDSFGDFDVDDDDDDDDCHNLRFIAPLLKLACLRSLRLYNCRSASGISGASTITQHRFKEALLAADAISVPLKHLELHDCKLTGTDLQAFMLACPKLETLKWEQSFYPNPASTVNTDGRLIGSNWVVSCLTSLWPTLKELSISVKHEHEGEARRSLPDRLKGLAGLCQPINFTTFRRLESLKISTLALGASGNNQNEAVRFIRLLPQSLRRLEILTLDFHTCYHWAHGFSISTDDGISKMLVAFCAPLLPLFNHLPSLHAIDLRTKESWRPHNNLMCRIRFLDVDLPARVVSLRATKIENIKRLESVLADGRKFTSVIPV